MEKLKLSIIIPVYNTGEFLKDCVNSVMAQTLKEWELILVDDGSTDNSGKICDEYAERDKRIRVIHKENEGVSVARNIGLDNATGEFIGFADSDDMIEPEMFKIMYEKAQKTNSQIVMCDAVTVYKNGETETDTIGSVKKSREIKRSDLTPLQLTEMAGSVWRCIYKRELLKDHNIIFPVGLKFSEDRIFNIYAFGFADKIYYIKKPFYNRLIWEGSAVHRFHKDYFETAKKAAKGIQNAIETAWDNNTDIQNEYKKQLIGFSIGAINNYFYKTSPLTLKEKYEAVKMLCEDKMLLDAIASLDYDDIRVKFIRRKQTLVLCVLAWLVNKKYKR